MADTKQYTACRIICQGKVLFDEHLFLAYKNGMNLLNTSEAAERLGVSTRRVLALIEEGKLRAQKVGRDYAIEESALEGVSVYGKPGRPPKPKAEVTTKQTSKKRGAKK